MYNTLFPDEKFRNYLLNESYGKDGELTENEINDITQIIISDRNISSLAGIEYFTALELLWCYDNQLTALDMSNNTALTLLECYNNSIKGADMDALVGSLPQNTTSSSQLFIIVDISKDAPEGNVCTRAQAAVAKAKGWTVKAVDGDEEMEYEGSDIVTGISGAVCSSAEATPVFTLSGQRIAAPRKGINIAGGKKIMVK